MAQVPEAIREGLVKEIFRRADSCAWNALSAHERSQIYDQWLADPEIGGVLVRYLPPERARGWIKDVPMKHYRNAHAGVGTFAALVPHAAASPANVCELAMGPGWAVVDGSVRNKPSRCVVAKGDSRVEMIWGEPGNFGALVWAAIKGAVDSGSDPLVVITLRPGLKIADSERVRDTKLAARASIEVRHVTLRDSPRESKGS